MNVLERIGQVKHLFFDIDGVLTDGSVTVFNDGSQIRKFNIKDGWAISRCVKLGYNFVVISAGRDDSVIKRLQYLGVKEINIGVTDKLDFFQKYLNQNGWELSNCLYMGDDMADYLVMKQKEVLSVCPQDAADDIVSISDYVCSKNGGYGAAREILEKLLKIQDKWISL